MNIIDQDIFKDTKLFYLENNAPPLHQEVATHSDKDRRTYHRIVMFDAIAKFEFHKLGIPVRPVNAFYSTLALFDKLCDW